MSCCEDFQKFIEIVAHRTSKIIFSSGDDAVPFSRIYIFNHQNTQKRKWFKTDFDSFHEQYQKALIKSGFPHQNSLKERFQLLNIVPLRFTKAGRVWYSGTPETRRDCYQNGAFS